MNSLLLKKHPRLSPLKNLLTLLLVIFTVSTAFSQNGIISGTIKTVDGHAAEAVIVGLMGSTKGATTDHAGHYTIHNVKAGNYTIVASLMGLQSQQQSVTVNDNQTATIDFVLKENSSQLQEVVVNTRAKSRYVELKSNDAAKMPLTDLENPQAYTTVTTGLMSEQGVYNMDGALKNVPGAYQLWQATDRSGFGNGSSFVLRGFQLNTYLRNGLPANVSTTIDNANIESVEVLKGPSATLFGSAVTSYGGLINRVTKQPFDHFGGEVTYDAGSYGFNRLTADVNSPLDSAKKMLFRINTSLNTQNSWQDAGFHRSLFVAPSFTYKVNDRLSFSLDAEIYKSAGTTPQMFFFDTSVAALGVNSADQLNLDYNRAYKSNDMILNSGNINLTAQMNYKMSDNWKSQTTITTVNTNSLGPMPYFYLLPGNNQIARMVWTIDGSDNTFDIQQNFVGKFNTGSIKHRVVAGLDYYSYSANVRYHEFNGTAGGMTAGDLFDIIPSNGYIPNYLNFNQHKVDSVYANAPADPYEYIINNKTYISSAYVSDVFNITDRLIANAALRLDHFDYGGDYNLQTGVTSGKYQQTALSPKFGVVYQVVKDQVSLFGNYQNGFTNENGNDFQGHHFKPEEANQWEGGIKLNAFEGRLNGTISYYDISVSNVLRTDIDHPNFSIQNGTQLSKGFEAELNANLFTGFNISAGYAYNNSKYTNADADVNGLRPNASGPANMANLWLSYRFTHGDLKGLGLGFGGNYNDKALVESSRSEGQFWVPSYTLFNSTVFYDAGRFRIGANVNNLTNKKYWIGWYTVNPQQPRSISASLAFRF